MEVPLKGRWCPSYPRRNCHAWSGLRGGSASRCSLLRSHSGSSFQARKQQQRMADSPVEIMYQARFQSDDIVVTGHACTTITFLIFWTCLTSCGFHKPAVIMSWTWRCSGQRTYNATACVSRRAGQPLQNRGPTTAPWQKGEGDELRPEPAKGGSGTSEGRESHIVSSHCRFRHEQAAAHPPQPGKGSSSARRIQGGQYRAAQ